MSNRIRHIQIDNICLVPAEAELRLSVELEQVTPTTEVRGRLMGPRCPYSSTVEIAYPLRPARECEPGQLAYRVIIPEANLWDPVSPFLYEGPVELWEDGHRVDEVHVSHGLRSLTVGARGLRINGRPFQLRGREVEHVTEAQLRAWRTEGINLLLSRSGENTDLWRLADRLGFLVLIRGEPPRAEWRMRPSCLDVSVQVVPASEAARVAETGTPVLAAGRVEGDIPAVLGWFD
jgi:Glycosyl hydrolases family 2